MPFSENDLKVQQTEQFQTLKIKDPVRALNSIIDISNDTEFKEIFKNSGIILTVDQTGDNDYLLRFLGYFVKNLNEPNAFKVRLRDVIGAVEEVERGAAELNIGLLKREYMNLLKENPLEGKEVDVKNIDELKLFRLIVLVPSFSLIQIILSRIVAGLENKETKITNPIYNQMKLFRETTNIKRFLMKYISKLGKYKETFEDYKDLVVNLNNNIMRTMSMFKNNYTQLIIELDRIIRSEEKQINKHSLKSLKPFFNLNIEVIRQTIEGLTMLLNDPNLSDDVKKQIARLINAGNSIVKNIKSDNIELNDLKDFNNRITAFLNGAVRNLTLYNALMLPYNINLAIFYTSLNDIITTLLESDNVEELVETVKKYQFLVDTYLPLTKKIITGIMSEKIIKDNAKISDNTLNIFKNIVNNNNKIMRLIDKIYNIDTVTNDLIEISQMLNDLKIKKGWRVKLGNNLQSTGFVSYIAFIKNIEDNPDMNIVYIIWLLYDRHYELTFSIDLLPINTVGLKKLETILKTKDINELRHLTILKSSDFMDSVNKWLDLGKASSYEDLLPKTKYSVPLLEYISNLRENISTTIDQINNFINNIDKRDEQGAKIVEMSRILKYCFEKYDDDLELLGHSLKMSSLLNISINKLLFGEDKVNIWHPIMMSVKVYSDKISQIISKIIDMSDDIEDEITRVNGIKMIYYILRSNSIMLGLYLFPELWKIEDEINKALKSENIDEKKGILAKIRSLFNNVKNRNLPKEILDIIDEIEKKLEKAIQENDVEKQKEIRAEWRRIMLIGVKYALTRFMKQ